MSFYNSLPQEDLADLLRAYDSYISTAADAGLLTTGWTPVCVEEFYGAEYQNVWDSEKGDESFYYMYDYIEATIRAEANDLPIPDKVRYGDMTIFRQGSEFLCQVDGETQMRPIRSQIQDIEAGDAFIVKNSVEIASYDAHQNFDEPDEPWIVYDHTDTPWFEEDIMPAEQGIQAILKNNLEKSGPKPSLDDKIRFAENKSDSFTNASSKEHAPGR